MYYVGKDKINFILDNLFFLMLIKQFFVYIGRNYFFFDLSFNGGEKVYVGKYKEGVFLNSMRISNILVFKFYF